MAHSSSVSYPITAPVRVLLVDDHSLVRAGIRRLLDDDETVEVIAEADNCDEAIQTSRRERPDVVLMDMNGLCISVLDGSRRLQRQIPEVKIVVMSVTASTLIPERLVRNGVQGCLTKSCSEAELIEALHTVHRGKRYISLQLAQQLAAKRLSDAPLSPFEALTHRELQVMLLVVQGRSSTQIAKTLCLTQKTVNGYRNRVMEKLGVGTDVQLTHLALEQGVLDLGNSR